MAKDNACIANPFTANSAHALAKYLADQKASGKLEADDEALIEKLLKVLAKADITHNMAHINVHLPKCSVAQHPRFVDGSGSYELTCLRPVP